MEQFKNSLVFGSRTAIILGSGSSIDYFPKAFWEKMTDDRLIFTVNHGFKRFNTGYSVFHHHKLQHIIESAEAENFVFVSEYNAEKPTEKFNIKQVPGPLRGNIFIYPHLPGTFTSTNLHVSPLYDDDDTILTGSNTIIDAIGIAWYKGARHFILAGCDAGSIDGQVNYKGYYPGNYKKSNQKGHSLTSLRLMQMLRDEITKLGGSVTMLSPFLDFNLEGRQYDQNMPDDQSGRKNFKFETIK